MIGHFDHGESQLNNFYQNILLLFANLLPKYTSFVCQRICKNKTQVSSCKSL